jgi:hypothetical protein
MIIVPTHSTDNSRTSDFPIAAEGYGVVLHSLCAPHLPPAEDTSAGVGMLEDRTARASYARVHYRRE